MTDTIRIGGAAAFWGDSLLSAPQLVAGGDLDFLTFDYLAEITMSILARARAKDPAKGYATDFVTHTLRMVLKDCLSQGIRIIANAGGTNARACAEAIEALSDELEVAPRVAVVLGDDLIDRADGFRDGGVTEMFSGAAFPEDPKSINAYLGAGPIATALDRGADIVVTGRCADSAIALGACIHSFGWSQDAYDLLAAGSLAGHVIECGAQVTGGLFTDWQVVADGWWDIGYPIVEVGPDGSFVVSKPPQTGGLVSVGTVSEQIVYEIGDPRAYILPDVVCDFSDVGVEQIGPDAVRVTGARGRAPTPTYKVSATYQDGYRLTLHLAITGIDADSKAKATGEAVLARVSRMFAARKLAPLRETSLEVIGAEAGYGSNSRVHRAREVILKLAAKHEQPQALQALLREATSAGTSMSPGTSGLGGNRPRPAPVVRLFSFLLPKDQLTPRVEMAGERLDIPVAPGTPLADSPESDRDAPRAPPVPEDERATVALVELAWGRSGDKGDSANIGIIARRSDYLPWVRDAVTAEAVNAYFAHLVHGPVERFDLPGLGAINLVLHESLGGGGIASLRHDAQGKTFAQMLLDHPVSIPRSLVRRDGLIAQEPNADNP